MEQVKKVTDKTETWEGQYGDMCTDYVVIEDGEEIVQVNRKATSPQIKAGMWIEGPNQWGKYKKAQDQPSGQVEAGKASAATSQPPAGGSPRPGVFKDMKPDPYDERQWSIIRQHSQEMALRYADTSGLYRGVGGDDGALEILKPLIDWFQKDATPGSKPLSPGDQFKAEMEAQNGHVSPERAIQLAERVDKWDAPMLRAALQAIGIHNIHDNPEDTLAELTEDQAKALEALV